MKSLLLILLFTHLASPFRQVRESAFLTEPQVLTGQFTYDAPDQVTWQYDSGLQARLPEPLLRLIAQAVNPTALSQTDDFTVEQTADTLTLTPRKPRLKKLFSQITIRFGSNGLAEQVVMTEPTGDATTITFLDMTAQ